MFDLKKCQVSNPKISSFWKQIAAYFNREGYEQPRYDSTLIQQGKAKVGLDQFALCFSNVYYVQVVIERYIFL
jgi:hypothetical protein